jgi:hypothetical protein
MRCEFMRARGRSVGSPFLPAQADADLAAERSLNTTDFVNEQWVPDTTCTPCGTVGSSGGCSPSGAAEPPFALSAVAGMCVRGGKRAFCAACISCVACSTRPVAGLACTPVVPLPPCARVSAALACDACCLSEMDVDSFDDECDDATKATTFL